METEKKALNRFCKRLCELGFDIFGIAQDAAVWRTLGAKGNRREGREGGSRVLIEEGTGQILGGLGGKYTGMTVGEMKQKSKQETKQKQAAAINAKAQQKAYGKGMHDAQNAATQAATATAAAVVTSAVADPAEQKIMELMKQMDALADKYEASSNAEEQAQIEKEFDKLTEEMHKAAEQTQTGKAKPQPKTYASFEDTPEAKKLEKEHDKLVKQQNELMYKKLKMDAKADPQAYSDITKQINDVQTKIDKTLNDMDAAETAWTNASLVQQNKKAVIPAASFEDTPEYKKLADKKDKAKQKEDKALAEIKKIKQALQNPNISSEKYNDLQDKLKAANKKFDKADSEFSDLELQIAHDKVEWEQKNKQDVPSTASSLASYETPYGKKSPIPSFLPHGSMFVNKLKNNNFPTGDNEVGYDSKKPWNKQGFTQTKIPIEQDLKSSGFYADGTPPSGYWDGVPHLKNPHPDMKKIGKSKVMECADYTDDAMLNVYRHKAHNNVPFASAYNTAAGQAAAYSYTACSNTLNDTLRFGENTQSGKPSSDKQKWSEDTALVTKELDKMLSVSRTKEPMTVYRGIDFLSEEQFYNDYKKGKVLEDKGFMSTSINPRKSSSFAASTWGLFKIRVPAGASAVSLRYTKDGKHGFSAYEGEDEILLPRNTKYKIVGFEEGKGPLAKYKKIPIVEIVQE